LGRYHLDAAQRRIMDYALQRSISLHAIEPWLECPAVTQRSPLVRFPGLPASSPRRELFARTPGERYRLGRRNSVRRPGVRFFCPPGREHPSASESATDACHERGGDRLGDLMFSQVLGRKRSRRRWAKSYVFLGSVCLAETFATPHRPALDGPGAGN
jgi:hypothetical protein